MPTTYPIVTLKPGRESHTVNRHHAIFENAIEKSPHVPEGSIVEIRASDGAFLCYATFNARSYICARAIAFEPGDPMAAMERAITSAIEMRKTFFSSEDTTAYRLVNAEGDSIPGLIVDQYGDVLVVQLTTYGMDRLRPWIVDTLQRLCNPRAIFEKSTGQARKKEGLEPREGWLKGEVRGSIEVRERGLKFLISFIGTQKTGLFLDQREMRTLVGLVAKGRTVLDCCSYVGGFSLAALKGGALAADAVDYDKDAVARCKKHLELNGVDTANFGSYVSDAFEFFRRKPLPRAYDFIILDPPAFAKRSADLEHAKRAYIDLNRMALLALPPKSLLLTCSCSYQVDQQIFQTVLFHSARQAKRKIRILHRHRQAFDHPVNLYHPEVDYLKSMLLWVE